MNDKRFSKVLLVFLLVLAFATTNAVEAIQSGQELSPDPANENNSFGSVTWLTEANGSITGTLPMAPIHFPTLMSRFFNGRKRFRMGEFHGHGCGRQL
jgi:hypothetical protein